MRRDEDGIDRDNELYKWFWQQGYSHESRLRYCLAINGFIDPIKQRFDQWWKTGRLCDDLEICGMTIGEITSRTTFPIHEAFILFNDAFMVPWSYDKEERYREPTIHERFSMLGWREEEDYFPPYEELLEWFKSHDHNARYSIEIEAKQLEQLVRPLRERFVDWWLTGVLRDDLEYCGWTLGRFLRTFVKGAPVAFSDFNALFRSPIILPLTLEKYDKLASASSLQD